MPMGAVLSKDLGNSARPQCSESPAQWMKGHLFVVEHIRRMRGESQSHLMRCSDNNYYVVKFQGNPQGTRILVNELLGTQLAARLGLPTTPVAACHVSEDLIQLTPDLCFETPKWRIPCPPGLHFGSRYPLDPHCVTVFDFFPDNQLFKVRNLRDFVGMVVFDKWTCNTDGRQTIFYREQTGSPYRTVMIDQGGCFNGDRWSFPDASLYGLYCRRVVYEHVSGMDNFEPWLTKLESEINLDMLMNIAQGLPPEWYEFDVTRLQRLLERLDRRRGKVRELLWSAWKLRRVFPNWVEKELTMAGSVRDHSL